MSLLVACMAVFAACLATTPERIQPTASGPKRTADPSSPSNVSPVGAVSPAPVIDPGADPGGTSPDPGPTAPAITPEVCTLRVQPGPADAAPTKGDLMDWSHIWGGRARVCISGPVPREYEGTAWCTWSDGFGSVTDAALLPRSTDAANGHIDAGLSLERRTAYLSFTPQTGDITNFEGAFAGQDLRSNDQGRRGIVRFEVHALPTDPEHPPASLPPDVVGVLRWSCLEPAHR